MPQQAETLPIRDDTGRSCFGMLLVYCWVTISTSQFFGQFAWGALVLMLAATVLAVWLHLRPRLRGPADESMLAGILLASLALMIFLTIGHTLKMVRVQVPGFRGSFRRLNDCGMAIRFLMVAVLLVALTYRGRARGWLLRVRAWRFGLLCVAALCMRVLLLIAAPDPGIDVHVLQEVGAKGFVRGRNVYTLQFPSPYEEGETFDQYCYPPATIYATTGAWMLFKEIRAAWLICDMLGAILLFLVARRMRPGPENARFHELVALVFLFMPRSLYVLEKAWTEPLAVAALGALVYCMVRKGRQGLTGFLLGFWLCSKQYMVLALPSVLKLRRWSRAAWVWGAAAVAAVMVPFALWDFGAFYHDLVGFFLKSEARPDALSIYGALNRFGYDIPWWVLVPLWATGAAFFTWKMERTISGWLFAAAGTWLFFFMFGKQAFMNYFYLIGFTLLLAVAAYQSPGVSGRESPDRRGEEIQHAR